jgi:hypothetical protein
MTVWFCFLLTHCHQCTTIVSKWSNGQSNSWIHLCWFVWHPHRLWALWARTVHFSFHIPHAENWGHAGDKANERLWEYLNQKSAWSPPLPLQKLPAGWYQSSDMAQTTASPLARGDWIIVDKWPTLSQPSELSSYKACTQQPLYGGETSDQSVCRRALRRERERDTEMGHQ